MKRRYSEWEIETNGITTVVSEWGEGDRNAVLLHGVSSNRAYWSDLGPELAARGWHVYAPNLRGAAESRVTDNDQVGWKIGVYVDDLAVWTEAFGLSSFTLAGHSFGGRLSVNFAARYPERVDKLILIAAAGPDALTEVAREHPELVAQESGRGYEELAEIEGHVLDALRQLYERRPGQPAPRAVVQRWLANLEIDEQGNARHHDIVATAEAQMNIIRTEDQTPLLADLTMPAVVLRSVEESDMLRHVIPHYAEHLPNATFIDDIPGGHDTPTASPEHVLAAFE